MVNAKLYNGDCLEIMKQLPDNSIDMILCDLPYGSLKQKIADGWKSNDTDISWDKIISIDKLFDCYDRIVRQNGAILLFNKEPLTTQLRNHGCKNIEYSYTYVWKKSNFSNPYIANKSPLSICENIDVFYKKYSNGFEPYDVYRFEILKQINKPRSEIIKMCGESADHFFRKRTKQFITENGYNQLIKNYQIDNFDNFLPYDKLAVLMSKSQRTFNLPNNKTYIIDLLDFPKDNDNVHPTQKPIALLEYLINIYTNENDIVLDNCMGSGSTGIACKNLNRNFIGIELDENYFKIAKERIEKHNVSKKLF